MEHVRLELSELVQDPLAGVQGRGGGGQGGGQGGGGGGLSPALPTDRVLEGEQQSVLLLCLAVSARGGGGAGQVHLARAGVGGVVGGGSRSSIILY